MAKNIKVTLTLDDRQYQRKIKKTNSELKGLGGQNNKLMAGFGKLGPAIAAAFTIGAIIKFGQQIRTATIEIENIRNQLTLVTDSAQDLDRVFALLTQTAANNRTSFAATAELFTKLKVATGELGRSEEEVVNVTSKLSQALQVAGADAATTNSVVRQFGQAMASGTVRGDEFNSLVEGLGPALAIMARETGVGVGELRKMSQAGELTADVLFDMIGNSTLLSASFNEMSETTEQLETALGDSFNRFLVKIGEASGVTEAYKKIVKGLTRELNILAQAEGSLPMLGLPELVEAVEADKVTIINAIDELEARLDLVGSATGSKIGDAIAYAPTDIPPGMFNIVNEALGIGAGPESAEVTLIKETIANLKELQEVRKAQKAENDKIIAANTAIAESQKAIVKSVEDEIKLGNEIKKARDNGQYLTELEKIEKRIADTKNTMDALRGAFMEYHAVNNDGIPTLQDYEQFLKDQGFTLDDLITEYGAAQMALIEYNDELNKGKDDLKGYDKFMFDLLSTMVDYQETQGFIKTGLAEIDKSFKEGAITLEQYTFLFDQLNQLMEKGKTDAEKYRELISGIMEDMEDVTDMETYLALQDKLNQLMATGALEMSDYISMIAQLKNTFQQVDEVAAIVMASIEDLSKGLSDDLTNAIMNGESLMDGMKDTFKRVVTQMISDAMRLNIIQPLLSSIFGGSFGAGGGYTPGGGGAFGFIKGLFGFQHGGQAHAGRPYLVGERGPELFVPDSTGNVMPNGSTGQSVTYNINAVDAKSFKQMVAADPEFIFGVTQAGARRIPS
tara:strand:- start:285 stop:2657 length:2373 start_codon:yes stop_codon:yes gene_type:complete